ncbi:serine/arginine repetitive matrix protein 1 [Tetranychus urticae]|uniref:HTH OST-type domain-containing protein n=1 Tax=Tetranychus urticae TaxID=32264 RepID=T1KKG3_TETUR|nr:serine/arginine repetitive matrix protein 1 [Tetranychus urticae]XP_025017200.1 serine/arginine repetitive matrix protein 1 [Tetranychus urticae]
MASLEEIKKILKSLVISHQNGLSAIALNNEFLEIEGRHVPWQSFGAASLNEFFLSLTDILVYQPNKAGARVFFAKTDEATAHIDRLVKQQKPQPLKRRNEIFRYEVEKRPYREPSPEPRQISPPSNGNLPDSTQKFRNPSPPPPDPKNMLFRSSSPEKSKLKRPSPQDSPPTDPYEESLRRARERRGIARRNYRSRRSRSRSSSPRRTKSPSPKRNSSTANRHTSSPNQRRQRSPTPKRGNSPVQRRQRSPSPWRGNSPVQRRQRSPSPRRGSSPVYRRQRSPSPRRGSSPVYRRQRSPSPRRGSSPVHRRQRSPSPKRGSSPVQSRQRSPVRKIPTKSISCQTDFEKVSKSCQTEVSNTHCISCKNQTSKSHVPNGTHPRPTNNSRQDYSNADENVDLNQLYYGTEYSVAPTFQCLYNPYSILPVLDPSFTEDTTHPEPGFYYDFDAGDHKPIPRIPEYYAYWIMAGWIPAAQETTPQANHAPVLPSSQSADPRVNPPAAKNAKARDPRLARSEARISPNGADKVAAKRKSISIDDYKNLRKLGSNEQSDKSGVITGAGETIDYEPVITTEPVAKLPRDPRLRRAK